MIRVINTIERKLHISRYNLNTIEGSEKHFNSIEYELECGWSYTEERIKLVRPLFINMLLCGKRHLDDEQYQDFIHDFECFDAFLWK